MEITKSASIAVDRYFNKLSKLGYCSYDEVNKMITLFAIKDIVDNYIMTESQYRLLQNVLICLFGSSCLFPYPSTTAKHSIIYKDAEAFLRLSEASINRISEFGNNRTLQ